MPDEKVRAVIGGTAIVLENGAIILATIQVQGVRANGHHPDGSPRYDVDLGVTLATDAKADLWLPGSYPAGGPGKAPGA